MTDSKRCPKCHEAKARSEFHKDSRNKDGLYAYCKECNKAKARAWAAANPDKVLARSQRRAAAGVFRANNLRYKYGLTLAEYDALLAAQGGVCAICGRADARREGHRNLVVDHCHTSDRIRGLLCHSCNRGIGLLQDSAEILKKALTYLS